MSGSFNKLILMGRLATDTELKRVGSDALCKVRIAVNKTWSDKATGEKKETPLFINLDIWGPRGEQFAKYHSKGSPCFVEGELTFRQYEKDGQMRDAYAMKVFNWEFVGGKQEGSGERGGQQEAKMFLDAGEVPF